MTVFSPTALMRVLTTLVDHSLEDAEAPRREPTKRRRARRARFSQGSDPSGDLRPHLELAGRGEKAHDPMHGQVD
jgi:hypothetical protein